MCGVFGYVGEEDALEKCLTGLEQLEYRGYDSAGIAGLRKGALLFCKKAGALSLLKQALDLPPLEVAIAHTRWATHGRVSDENAHPHFDASQSLAIIHNGIIENFDALRAQLKRENVHFVSQTDTEVVAHLIGRYYEGDLVQALSRTLAKLKGAFSLLLIHKDHPHQIVAAARNCPLSIALGKNGALLSSDPNTFTGSSFDLFFLQKGEIARVQRGGVEIFEASLKRVERKAERFEADFKPPSKEGFPHYLLKEISEQPTALQRAILGRSEGVLEELQIPIHSLRNAQKVWIVACGTSAHAGSLGALLFEDLARLPASCEIASEARYRAPLLSSDTLVLAISQSGETADTLAALQEVAKTSCEVIALCNVKNSSLAREVSNTLFLKAGPEVSVCSTKAFTSQLALLFLLALSFGRLRKTISEEESRLLFSELKKIPAFIQTILDRAHEMEALAEKYAQYGDFFFMGRRYMFPTCLEAALKLKEITYINANGYPAGELKHGAIALLHSAFPVLAFCANETTQEKITSNLMEVKARGAPLLAFAPETMHSIEGIADDIFWLPPVRDELAPFCSSVAGQLFAYYVACKLGRPIDKPRHLAKSVTVE